MVCGHQVIPIFYLLCQCCLQFFEHLGVNLPQSQFACHVIAAEFPFDFQTSTKSWKQYVYDVYNMWMNLNMKNN